MIGQLPELRELRRFKITLAAENGDAYCLIRNYPQVLRGDPKHVKESDLYPPIKRLLEDQGYTVKSEIGAVDVMALRANEPPVIVELKLNFSLTVIHQAIARLAVSDDVYIAVAHKPGKRFAKSVRDNVKLARRLGIGVIVVRVSDGLVTVHADPGPYTPRKSKVRTARLLREFAKRSGDPNAGGQARQCLVTAYRQDALRVAVHLFELGACKGSDVARETGVVHATRMMRDDHYGWFEKVEKGIYGLSPKGAEAVKAAGDALGA